MNSLICLLSVFIFSKLEAHKHYFSICAMFKNEAPYLKEWIEYHLIQGVEHFYLYNNDSSDHFRSILKPYMDKHIVDCIDWPSAVNAKNHVSFQTKAYNEALNKYGPQNSWMAFIDIDEFLVPIKQGTTKEFLSIFDGEETIGTISINWQLFGTSHIHKLEQNQLVTESFILKAEDHIREEAHLDHYQIKSIIRPHCVTKMTIHYPDLKKGFLDYPEGLKGGSPKSHKKHRSQMIHKNEIVIHHYWTRDEEFFNSVKIGRKEAVFAKTKDKLIIAASKMNALEDKTIFKFMDELKYRMALSEF